MPQLVVELFEVVDVEQAHGQWSWHFATVLSAFHAQALGFESLDQTAAVGHLGELVGGDLLRQTHQLALQFLNLFVQLGGFAVFVLQPCLSL